MLRPWDVLNLLRYADIGKTTYQLLSRGTLNTLEHCVWVAANEDGRVTDKAPTLLKKIRRLRRLLYGTDAEKPTTETDG